MVLRHVLQILSVYHLPLSNTSTIITFRVHVRIPPDLDWDLKVIDTCASGAPVDVAPTYSHSCSLLHHPREKHPLTHLSTNTNGEVTRSDQGDYL